MPIDENTSFAEIALKLAQEADATDANENIKTIEQYLFESLGIDSLDIVEMIMDLESELGVELEMEDQKITTFQELADFIESKLN